jgi:hypothetical protein
VKPMISTDEAAAGTPSAQRTRIRRPGRRGRWAVVAVVVAAGAAVAVLSGAFGSSGPPSAGGAAGSYATSTALVRMGSLTSQTQVSATLGDAGAYTAVNQATGTITWLPQVGQTVRPGRTLYKVNGVPVILLRGNVPSFESLSAGMIGPDVTELNSDLVALGYATAAALGPKSGWNYFSGETAYSLGLLQAKRGLPVTDTLPLGQAVFLPTAVLVTAWETGVAPGSPAAPGVTVLTASSVTPVVTISLDASQQTEVKAGDKVSIILPSGSTTPGVVSQVGTVATAPASDSSSGSSTPTIPVIVTLSNPMAAGHLNSAPVTVTITTASVRNVLIVPVDALLAQSSGGYDVEVVTGSRHRLVPVRLGLFDDAAGLVQVSGPGLASGQRVVVPAI